MPFRNMPDHSVTVTNKYLNLFSGEKPAVLAVCFATGTINLMKSYDDLFPTVIETNLKGKVLNLYFIFIINLIK